MIRSESETLYQRIIATIADKEVWDVFSTSLALVSQTPDEARPQLLGHGLRGSTTTRRRGVFGASLVASILLWPSADFASVAQYLLAIFLRTSSYSPIPLFKSSDHKPRPTLRITPCCGWVVGTLMKKSSGVHFPLCCGTCRLPAYSHLWAWLCVGGVVDLMSSSLTCHLVSPVGVHFLGSMSLGVLVTSERFGFVSSQACFCRRPSSSFSRAWHGRPARLPKSPSTL